MSKIQSISGMRYKKENFNSLKQDIMTIQSNFAGGAGPNVTLNDNCEFVCRIQNKNAEISKSSPEQKYLLNEILKYYELNSNQKVQGFNSNYFKDLTELMSKKNMKANEYSKKRIELFNLRVNNFHESYINYLKKEGKDTKMQSSMNKTINPMSATFHLNLNNKNPLPISRTKKIKKPDSYSFIELKNSYLKQFPNNFFYRYENSAFSLNNENYFRKRNNPKNRILFKSASYLNKFEKENNEQNLAQKLSALNINIKEDDTKKNDAEMELKEKKSKEEYLNTRNKKNYMNFLKSKYQFIEDKAQEKKEYKLSIKDIKVFNMFKYRPKALFVKLRNKNEGKKLFFRKIEKEMNKSTAFEPNLKLKPIRKKPNKIQLSKFNSLNYSINQIYSKYFKSD